MTQHEAETIKAILDTFNINSGVCCCITGDHWYIHIRDKIDNRIVHFDIHDTWTVTECLSNLYKSQTQDLQPVVRPRLSILRLIPSRN